MAIDKLNNILTQCIRGIGQECEVEHAPIDPRILLNPRSHFPRGEYIDSGMQHNSNEFQWFNPVILFQPLI